MLHSTLFWIFILTFFSFKKSFCLYIPPPSQAKPTQAYLDYHTRPFFLDFAHSLPILLSFISHPQSTRVHNLKVKRQHLFLYINKHSNLLTFNLILISPHLTSFLQMGRQNSESMVMHSSIALLQERFRQLQRVKEMREERVLLSLFSETERLSPTTQYEPTRPFQVIRPETKAKHAHYQAVDTPLLMSLWPTDRSIMRSSHTFEDGDVDTSLHL